MTSAERELLLSVAQWLVRSGNCTESENHILQVCIDAVRGSPAASLQDAVKAARDYADAATSYASRGD